MTRRPTGQAFRAQLYYRMLLIRRVEERIQTVYHLREMRSPPHLCMGHEAIAVGVCAALRGSDVVYPYYRSHGWYLAKGGDLDALMAELHGRESGCSRGWGGSMHVIDLRAGVMGTSAIVGGTIPQAAGAALAFRLRGQDAVTVVSFGDGAIEEGVFHETLNFAALRKLPLVFVGENNLYATNTHIRYRQAKPGIRQHGARFGIPATEADGNDVLAVHREATKAIARARRGQGPTLLEFHTYRLLEHCGVNEDHELGYRSQAEVRRWQARGPFVRAARFVTRAEAARMQAEIDTRIDAAFAHAQAAPWPTSVEPAGTAAAP